MNRAKINPHIERKLVIEKPSSCTFNAKGSPKFPYVLYSMDRECYNIAQRSRNAYVGTGPMSHCEESESSAVSILAQDNLVNIFSYLNTVDLADAFLTCQAWYKVMFIDYTWKMQNESFLLTKPLLYPIGKNLDQTYKDFHLKCFFTERNWRLGKYTSKRWHGADSHVVIGAARFVLGFICALFMMLTFYLH
jgi:hypothetical protein